MFEHILVATDASGPSRRAVVLAGEIAGDHASELVVLHAVPRVVSPSGTLDLEEPKSAREVVEASVRGLKDGGVSALVERSSGSSKDIWHAGSWSPLLR
jgi:nucleotide-binding universal stress UspA family protein